MRNKRNIRRLCILLVLSFVIGLWGCAGEKGNKSKEAPGTVLETNGGKRQIVDQAGRVVDIPEKVESIAYCYRIPARLLLSLGLGERITGVGKQDDFLDQVAPNLKTCDTVGQGILDIEALGKLHPDVVFHKASDEEGLDAAKKLGICSIGLRIENETDMLEALDIIGKVCHVEGQAEKVEAYYRTQMKDMQEQLKEVPSKPKVLIMGSKIGNVAHGDMMQGKMIELAAGENVAAEVDTNETWPTVGIEQICQWDPDYIFIPSGSNCTYSIDDVMKDQRLKELKAVKKQQVYQFPMEADSWEFPGMANVLGVRYLATKLHPDVFSIEELVQTTKEFYQNNYGFDITEESIRRECQ